MVGCLTGVPLCYLLLRVIRNPFYLRGYISQVRLQIDPKIKKIEIIGIGPIKNLNLIFNNHFNIICGKNGIGKTTILDCLAQSFGVHETSSKRSALMEKGNWNISIN